MRRSLSLTSIIFLLGCDPATMAADTSIADAPVGDTPAALDAMVPDAGSPDASTADAGAMDAGASDSGTEARDHGGIVQITQSGFDPVLVGLFGAFTAQQVVSLDFPELCTVMRAGACVAARCGSEPPPIESAGDLSVTRRGASLFMVSPTAGGTYGQSAAGETLVAGDVLSVAAAGDVVPAFAGDLVVPPAPEVTFPDTVSRAAGWTVTWDPTLDADLVVVSVSPSASDGFIAGCVVPASDGTLTVQETILEAAGAGDLLLSATSANDVEVTAGEYTISLRAGLGVSGIAASAP